MAKAAAIMKDFFDKQEKRDERAEQLKKYERAEQAQAIAEHDKVQQCSNSNIIDAYY